MGHTNLWMIVNQKKKRIETKRVIRYIHMVGSKIHLRETKPPALEPPSSRWPFPCHASQTVCAEVARTGQRVK